MLRLTGKVMAETHYPYGPGSYDTTQLATEITAAGLRPANYINGSGYATIGGPATSTDVVYDPALTQAEKTVLDAVVAAHVPKGPRRPRLLFSIWTDLGALAAAQKTNIWNWLSSGNPPLFTQDRGTNAADLLVLWTLQQLGGLGAADKNLVKQAAAAIYCLDNPAAFVRPTWDATVNVPGDEPIP